AILPIESLLRPEAALFGFFQTGSLVVPAMFPGIKNFLFGLAYHLLDTPAGNAGGRRVHERGPPLQVEAADAFACGIENELVAPLQLLEFLRARLDVHLEDILGTLELLCLLGERPLGLLALGQFVLKRRVGVRELMKSLLQFEYFLSRRFL